MRLRDAFVMGSACFVPAAPIVWVTESFAQQYLTMEEAKRVTFPEADRFSKIDVQLTEVQEKIIAERCDARVPSPTLQMWKAYKGERFLGEILLDQVIGKHLLIDYVVALTADRTVKQIEILEYRENYGAEIREEKWRSSFIGKSAGDPLRLREDIPNISGATYSSLHITEGVRRLLATREVLSDSV